MSAVPLSPLLLWNFSQGPVWNKDDKEIHGL